MERCLASIVANDYPHGRLEVLVVDGRSHDWTRRIVQDYAARFPFIRLLNNPREIVPVGLNIGIRAAQGEIIMRMDAHSAYAPDYISKCVKALDEYGADNVGGILKTVPRSETLMGKTIARALSHPFGIGNAYYRFAGRSTAPRWVDTVPYFCCRKDLFGRVGLFNEGLVRSEDIEFSLRLGKLPAASPPGPDRSSSVDASSRASEGLEFPQPTRKAGGRTLLVPDIVSYYFARSDLKSFMGHNFINGAWAIWPFLYSSTIPVSWRHLIPLAFVVGLLGTAAAAVLWSPGWGVFTAVLSLYMMLNLVASAHVAWRSGNLRYFFAMPAVFTALHLGYGLGSFWAFVTLPANPAFWKRIFGSARKRETDAPGKGQKRQGEGTP